MQPLKLEIIITRVHYCTRLWKLQMPYVKQNEMCLSNLRNKRLHSFCFTDIYFCSKNMSNVDIT